MDERKDAAMASFKFGAELDNRFREIASAPGHGGTAV